MKPADKYTERLLRVLRHVDRTLDREVSVEDLAEVAALSPYHFHRVFSACLGIGPLRYVRLARLERAAWRLAYRQGQTVLSIALDAGYAGPEAFARAFQRHAGQSPRSFRADPRWTEITAACGAVSEIRRQYMQTPLTLADVRVVDFPETQVAVLRHHGDPATIGESIRRFIAWRRAAGLTPAVSATYNVLHSDPDDCDAADFRLDICAAARSVAPNAVGVTAGLIPGGRCAVLRQMGNPDDFRAAALVLYAEWLSGSGEEPRDFPLFAHRVTLFPDVPEHEAITDLYLPLR